MGVRLGVLSYIPTDNIYLLVDGSLIEQFGQRLVVDNVLTSRERRRQHARFRIEPRPHLASGKALRIVRPFSAPKTFGLVSVDAVAQRHCLKNRNSIRSS